MKTFLVGGAVRDQILGLPVKDRDWVVVGATPQMMLDAGFTSVGKDFPVFLHPETGEEHALARKERSTGGGYDAFEFDTDPSVTLEEDLLRRDLTMNSVAMDHDGNFIDPFGGIDDINNRLIRHTSDAFAEDPVRILRVARFMARYVHLGVDVADETMELMSKMVSDGEVKHLVAERVWQEMEGALGEKNPQFFFHILREINAFKDVCPELELVAGVLANPHNNLNNKWNDDTPKHVKFAMICLIMELDKVESMINRLAMPNEFSDLLLACVKNREDIYAVKSLRSSEILTLVKLLDFRRNPEKIKTVLFVIQSTYAIDGPAKFINGIVASLLEIDEAMIAQTTEHKQDIAENINSARLRRINKFR